MNWRARQSHGIDNYLQCRRRLGCHDRFVPIDPESRVGRGLSLCDWMDKAECDQGQSRSERWRKGPADVRFETLVLEHAVIPQGFADLTVGLSVGASALA